MPRVLITGSSDGLGLMAGQLLAAKGHRVTLHARSRERAEGLSKGCPQAEAVLVGDLSTLAGMRAVAAQANSLGRFDAVIHNVGLGYREPRRVETVDGLSQLWAVNVLAPYVLTALMQRPDRLVYLSSGMHLGGDPGLNDLQWSRRPWNSSQAYSDTKLHDVLLAFGVARLWPEVLSNAVSPGWVPTRMGGLGAPDDIDQAHLTQAWLAVGNEPGARTTGQLLYHMCPTALNPAARDAQLQDRLIDTCRQLSGISLA